MARVHGKVALVRSGARSGSVTRDPAGRGGGRRHRRPPSRVPHGPARRPRGTRPADGVAELGRLDIVVANAGVLSIAVDEPTDDAARQRVWDNTLAVNLTGAWNTVEAAAPAMVEAGNGGAIVITSSTQGLKYAANNDLALTAYTVTKHGLVGLMRCTAADLAPHGIRVNSIHPTGVNTPMVTNEVMGEYGAKHPRLGDLMGNLLPVGVVEAEDISEAVLYLMSDSGRYVTGVTLPVDAGHLLQ